MLPRTDWIQFNRFIVVNENNNVCVSTCKRVSASAAPIYLLVITLYNSSEWFYIHVISWILATGDLYLVFWVVYRPSRIVKVACVQDYLKPRINQNLRFMVSAPNGMDHVQWVCFQIFCLIESALFLHMYKNSI